MPSFCPNSKYTLGLCWLLQYCPGLSVVWGLLCPFQQLLLLLHPSSHVPPASLRMSCTPACPVPSWVHPGGFPSHCGALQVGRGEVLVEKSRRTSDLSFLPCSMRRRLLQGLVPDTLIQIRDLNKKRVEVGERCSVILELGTQVNKPVNRPADPPAPFCLLVMSPSHPAEAFSVPVPPVPFFILGPCGAARCRMEWGGRLDRARGGTACFCRLCIHSPGSVLDPCSHRKPSYS